MLIRQTLRYTPATILSPILQMATILVWTHWLRPEELGLYALVIALQDLLHLVGTAWWSQYVLRYGGAPGSDTRQRLLPTEGFVLVVSGAGQIALLLLLAVSLLGPKLGMIDAISLATLTFGRTIMSHWLVRARAEQRIGVYVLAQILAPGLGLAISLSLFAAGGEALTSALAAMAFAHMAVGALLGIQLGCMYLRPRGDEALLKGAYRYGLLTMGAALAGWVSVQSVRFIVDTLYGTAEVGLMSVGWGIGQRIATQLGLVTTMAALPIAVATARDQGASSGLAQLHLGGHALVATLLPAAVGLTVLSAPLAEVIVAGPYRHVTAQILWLATLAGSARALRHHYLDDVLRLIERPKLLMVLGVSEAGLTAVLGVLGAVWYGSVGAVAGAAVAATAMTVFAAACLTWLDSLPNLRRFLPSLAASTLLAAFLLMFRDIGGLPGLLGLALAGSALYASCLLVLDRKLAAAFRPWLAFNRRS